jgi:hypothetical protein
MSQPSTVFQWIGAGVDEWWIGLSAWVIQDGNYADFHEGQEAEFAVEFHPEEGLSLGNAPAEVTVLALADDSYDVVGRVVAVLDNAWVIDFGLRAYQAKKPPDAVQIGGLVRGRIRLGLDPFFYFEDLAKRPEMPPLIYSWIIAEIRRQVAPLILKGGVWVRDPERHGWERQPKTDAWQDDDGVAEYLLTCRLLDLPPKDRSSTAINV